MKTVPVRLSETAIQETNALLETVFLAGKANIPPELSALIEGHDLSAMIVAAVRYTRAAIIGGRKGDDDALQPRGL